MPQWRQCYDLATLNSRYRQKWQKSWRNRREFRSQDSPILNSSALTVLHVPFRRALCIWNTKPMPQNPPRQAGFHGLEIYIEILHSVVRAHNGIAHNVNGHIRASKRPPAAKLSVYSHGMGPGTIHTIVPNFLKLPGSTPSRLVGAHLVVETTDRQRLSCNCSLSYPLFFCRPEQQGLVCCYSKA